MFKDGKIIFKNEDKVDKKRRKKAFVNILIVDDDEGIHSVTKLALEHFEFEGKRCNFISAYSGKEGREIMSTTPNIALALVDVVMETDNAGLELVDYIRNELHNNFIRIILRTGQPGQAPEIKVIHEYDINDYKDKSELTMQKLYTSVLTSLRTYRDIIAIERNREGLKKIIEATSTIEKMTSIDVFLSAILEQLISLLYLDESSEEIDTSCFIAAINKDEYLDVAGSGKFKDASSDFIFEETHEQIYRLINIEPSISQEFYDDGHYILYKPSKLSYCGIVLYLDIDEIDDAQDKNMVRLFLEKATTVYENSSLSKEVEESQREIIFTISEIAEQRSNETGKHVKRVAMYSKLLAIALGLTDKEADSIYVASSMHDIGKMGTPDSVLKKPGKLTDEEMIVMKNHASIGHKMLHTSKRDIMQMSASIANEHHEKFDGSGYPNGLKGEEITLEARIVALADVFDALGSRRVYKEQWSLDNILEYIKDERGKHFDPQIVDKFFENIESVLKIHEENKD